MNSPTRDFHHFIKRVLGPAPAGEAALLAYAENMVTAIPWARFEDRAYDVRHWHNMSPSIFGSTWRQRNQAAFTVYFTRLQIADFARALAGENEQFDDCSVIAVGQCRPNLFKLIAAQHPIPRFFRVSITERCRVVFDQPLPTSPRKELRQAGARPIGLDGASPGADASELSCNGALVDLGKRQIVKGFEISDQVALYVAEGFHPSALPR